jgi:plastocyanin
MRKVLALAFVAALFMFACGSSEPTDTASNDQTAAQDESADTGSDTGSEEKTMDVSGKDEADVELDDFYFSPNVIQGEAGQTVTLTLENEGDAEHNFTLEDQKIDEDIEPGDDVKVEVTFPESGSLEFHCEYHAGQGMTGSLEVAG